MHARAARGRVVLRTRPRLAALAVGAALGCSGGDPSIARGPEGPPLPWRGALVPEPSAPADNPTTPEKIALGRLLFYDPVLSTDRAVACATCHSEIWGLSDGLAVSIGVLGVGPTGPGRTGPNATRRNSPTLWNVGHRESLFWDGRAASLEDQALRPLTTPEELGRDPEDAVRELATNAEYRALFSAAFPDDHEPVTTTHLARALAAFQRDFVSAWAPYDRYVAGDGLALDEESVRGMFRFADLGCVGCHEPPLFESDRFADRRTAHAVEDDQGRFEATGDDADRARFRVPTLRNLRFSDPYFHGGVEATLEGAVRHEARLQDASVSESDVRAIARFLDKGLTDISRGPSRPKVVPSGLPVPLDGFRVPR